MVNDGCISGIDCGIGMMESGIGLIDCHLLVRLLPEILRITNSS